MNGLLGVSYQLIYTQIIMSISEQKPLGPTSIGLLEGPAVDFPIGGHVNVLSDYKETGPEIFSF